MNHHARKIIVSLSCFLFFFLQTGSLQAQNDFAPVPNGVFLNPYTGLRYDNAMGATMERHLSEIQFASQQRMQILMQYKIVGVDIIKQKKAFTTIFKQSANSDVLRFNALMQRFGLVANDAADCSVFAAILSYIVYTDGKKPDANQINRLKQQYRNQFLNDAVFQGMPSDEKLAIYEREAQNAISNYEYWQKAGSSLFKDKAKAKAAEKLTSLGLLPDVKVNVTAKNANKTGINQTKYRRVEIFLRRERSYLAATFEEDDKYIRKRSLADFEKILLDFDKMVLQSRGANNSLADALGTCVLMCYQIYTDGKLLSAAQLSDTKNWLRNDIEADPLWQKKNDMDKQKEYERYGINSFMIYSDYVSIVKERKKLSNVSLELRPLQEVELKREYEYIRSLAYKWLKDIFNPRIFTDHILKEEGFRER
jgi:Fe2+ transport system protein FeoA